MSTNSAPNTPAFQRWVLAFFAQHGRHDLPWRTTFDPYHVLVSELMLQQTQVERVKPKFANWLQQFPDLARLAAASPAQVITAWQGLGYNRRGLNLQRAAQMVMAEFGGQLPTSEKDLQRLPGVGPYTAAAIAAFAFNQPSLVIETNIRTVYLYHFFPGQDQVSDQDLLPLIASTLDTDQPRHWYSALMDYGTYLKTVVPNPSRRSRHHTPQSKFQGSRRQVRGQILKHLTNQPASHEELAATTQASPHLADAIQGLTKDGLIIYNHLKHHWQLVDR